MENDENFEAKEILGMAKRTSTFRIQRDDEHTALIRKS